MVEATPFMLVFPLLGLLVILTFGLRLGEKGVGIVACTASALAFAVAVGMLIAILGDPAGKDLLLWEWLQIGTLEIPIALKVDALSITMSLMVTGIGTLIHIYSVGYMHGDARFPRFFVYTNLFLVAMLVLVLANNYLLLFIGWELVGLCSYLLIGFWFEDLKNARAAMKAMIVNRIGDAAFLIGIFLIFWTFGSLRYSIVFSKAGEVFSPGAPVITAITLFLFIGAVGKSAQIPLFVWLPDAMAGPTPASALIHAATMVTAGVYMVVRSQVLYDLAPFSQSIILWVGAITALFSATIAVAQWDIKKVMAYSTISQLGYMMAAVGLGAYTAGIFHLISHAFFKALLFLSAGSVMHGTENESDMRNLGGLRRFMSTTFWAFMIGGFGLAGLPVFSGFWSKDEIITEAWIQNTGVALTLLITAALTAFYMFRQLYLVFAGEPRKQDFHPHESPQVMTWPMIILAALVVFGGLLNAPPFAILTRFLGSEEVPFQVNIAIVSVGLSGLGWLTAWRLYGRSPLTTAKTDPLKPILGPLYTLIERKYYIDEFYGAFIVMPYDRFSRFLVDIVDQKVIDQSVEGIGMWLKRVSNALLKIQTGYVRQYVLWFVLGVVFILGLVLISLTY